MGKNARDQIPPPIVTQPSAAEAQRMQAGDFSAQVQAQAVQAQQRASVADQQLAAAGIQPHDTVPLAVGDVVLPAPPPEPARPEPARVMDRVAAEQERLERTIRDRLNAVPAVTELAARALTNGAGMAREYAAAAGELCRTADTSAQARANARRLLRLALAHLET